LRERGRRFRLFYYASIARADEPFGRSQPLF
jgi:hypothetical protein